MTIDFDQIGDPLGKVVTDVVYQLREYGMQERYECFLALIADALDTLRSRRNLKNAIDVMSVAHNLFGQLVFFGRQEIARIENEVQILNESRRLNESE